LFVSPLDADKRLPLGIGSLVGGISIAAELSPEML
jgi:hypothetical protein